MELSITFACSIYSGQVHGLTTTTTRQTTLNAGRAGSWFSINRIIVVLDRNSFTQNPYAHTHAFKHNPNQTQRLTLRLTPFMRSSSTNLTDDGDHHHHHQHPTSTCPPRKCALWACDPLAFVVCSECRRAMSRPRHVFFFFLRICLPLSVSDSACLPWWHRAMIRRKCMNALCPMRAHNCIVIFGSDSGLFGH